MNNQKCHYCGASNFITAKQAGYANVMRGIMKSEELHHEICLNCGTVLRSYVKNPERLIKKAEKASQTD